MFFKELLDKHFVVEFWGFVSWFVFPVANINQMFL